MNITVIGCGYLGAVHACAMAELGHRVVGVDVDRDKVESLAEGRAPFHEPGFTEILRRRIEAGGLTFTTDFSAICGAQAHFVAVGTPQGPGGAADLTHVEAAVEAMKPYLGRCVDGAEIVVGKSTVPVGTAARLAPAIAAAGAVLAWNPEFLREGFAVEDTLNPDRMVYGLPDEPADAERATAVLDELYAPIIESGTPRLVMDYATAELADEGARVVVTDPAAAQILADDDDLPYDVAADLEEALTAADLVLLATEWDQYTRCDPAWAADLVDRRNVVDGRNALDPEAWRNAGFAYAAVGSR